MARSAFENSPFDVALRRPVTYGFLALCVVAYAATLLLGGVSMGGGLSVFGPTSAALFSAGSLSSVLVVDYRQWERLFSSGFLHVGILHILFNAAAIRSLGSILEDYVGSRRALFAYGMSLVFSGATPLLYAFASGTDQNVVGASGVACGVGATLWTLLVGVPNAGVAAYRKSIFAWLTVALLIGIVPGISFLGHLGGGAGGNLAGVILRRRGGVRLASDGFARAVDNAGFVLAAVAAVALLTTAVKARDRYAFVVESDALGQAIEDVRRWATDEEPIPYDDLPGFERSLNALRLSDGLDAARRKTLDAVAKLQEGASRPERATRMEALAAIDSARTAFIMEGVEIGFLRMSDE